MSDLLHNWEKKSAEHQKEYKRFLEKAAKPPERTRVLNLLPDLHEEAFSRIDCLQCANCCTTTGPLLKNKDIENLASHLKSRPADFTEKYLRIDEDNDYVFKKLPCPFLKEDNYCSVYSARPGACRDFPHTHQRDIKQKLGITYHNTMICPAVALVVEDLKSHYLKTK